MVLEEEADRERSKTVVGGSIHHFPRRVSLLHHNSRQNTKVIFGSTVENVEKEGEHGSKREQTMLTSKLNTVTQIH